LFKNKEFKAFDGLDGIKKAAFSGFFNPKGIFMFIGKW